MFFLNHSDTNSFPFDLTSPGPDQKPGKIQSEKIVGTPPPDRLPITVPQIDRTPPPKPSKPKKTVK
jgi:hypothetical protein